MQILQTYVHVHCTGMYGQNMIIMTYENHATYFWRHIYVYLQGHRSASFWRLVTSYAKRSSLKATISMAEFRLLQVRKFRQPTRVCPNMYNMQMLSFTRELFHCCIGDALTDGGKDISFSQPTPVWKLQRQIAHAALRYMYGHEPVVALESNGTACTSHLVV